MYLVARGRRIDSRRFPLDDLGPQNPPARARNRHATRAGSLRILLDEAPHALDGQLQLLLGRAISAAHETLTRRAERAAWHHRDLFFIEQLLGELVRGEAGR